MIFDCYGKIRSGITEKDAKGSRREVVQFCGWDIKHNNRTQLWLVLVVWNHGILFSIYNILGIIIPTDELIFFKMVIAPPTSYGKSPFFTREINYKCLIFNRYVSNHKDLSHDWVRGSKKLNAEKWLVGGLEPWNFMTFHILGIISPTDELHHFSEG